MMSGKSFLVWFTGLLMCSQVVSAEEKLQVMLQGSSTAGLSEVVESHGGTITHRLHIIKAVGATLTRAQLDKVLKSPLITRHIDDLAVSGTPEQPPEEDGSCNVGGSVELDIDENTIRWTLYNKQATPATLEKLQLTWPDTLGTVAAISVGDRLIEPALYQESKESALDIEIPPFALPAPGSPTLLEVRFNPAHQNHSIPLPLQRDFSIEATFAEDCSTKLIPGYLNNHEDFYYNRVAGADALHGHGITGKGVTVAVIDSGLWEHPALARNTAGKPRILARYDAITDTEGKGKEVFDESGHGTHMTSVIAHSGEVTLEGKPTGTFKGVAPDVNLVAVKAFDDEGQGDFLDIVRAVQWVVDNRETYDIKVLNLSFSAQPRWPYWQDPINQAVTRAWASGITVVAAAGNTGPAPMTIGSPGNLPYIITVGAFTDSWTLDTRDDDYIPDFSSRGPTPSAHIKPDIVAPGGHMTGITRPGSSLTKEHPNYLLRTGEFVMTGSSQASALVSGVAALLLQLEPDLSPDDIKCKLTSSAEPAINRDGLLAYSPFQQGHGQVNATRAVTLGQRGCGNEDMDIQREISQGEHFEGPAIIKEDGSTSLPGLHTMISPEPSEPGMSDTRTWGVKAHVERIQTIESDPDSDNSSPFDWQKMYLQEKAVIENLGKQPGD